MDQGFVPLSGVEIVRVYYHRALQGDRILFEKVTPACQWRRCLRRQRAAKRLVDWLSSPLRPWYGSVGFRWDHAWRPEGTNNAA